MSPSSILVVAALFLSACSPANKARVDELNEQSYAYHYRNLDSTKVLAERALIPQLASARAEHHLVFYVSSVPLFAERVLCFKSLARKSSTT